MKSWFVFVIGLKQKLRDRLGLGLTLFTTPVFVLLYWIFFGNSVATFHIGVLNERGASEGHFQASAVEKIEQFAAADGTRFFDVVLVQDRRSLDRLVKQGTACLGLVLSAGSETASEHGAVFPKATLIGDATTSSYRIASAILSEVLQEEAIRISGLRPPLVLEEVPLGLSGKRTPFEAYVPGLLVFAVIMLIFSSSMSVVREVEAGTLARIRLTSAGSFSLLLGLSAVQLLLGIVSVFITLSAAWLLGFKSHGSLVLAMAIAALTSLACVGIGMVIASLAKTQNRAFLIASAGMFLLVLFSGIIFPRPELTLIHLGSRSFDIFDVLPTTHMGAALGKVMTLGATFQDVVYEMVCLFFITISNFVLGAWLFERAGKPSTTVWEGLP